MTRNASMKNALFIVIGFVAYLFLFSQIRVIKVGLDSFTHQGLTSYILTYFILGIPIFIATYFINNSFRVYHFLGLSKNFLIGLVVGFLFALPMFLGGLLFLNFKTSINVEDLIAHTIVVGFMEELYFRGFLFGQLFRKTNFGFIPAVIFGALIFAAGHLYQSQNLNELIGIFLITFLGAVLFAWLYAEWNFNLWVPIFLHGFMNLAWYIFAVDNTALGGVNANIFRGLTIFIAIVFTIVFKRRNNEKFMVNRQSLFLKRRNDF